ncbi:MAG: esterase-like activity of phytase family protein [Phycisphaerales bacterium]
MLGVIVASVVVLGGSGFGLKYLDSQAIAPDWTRGADPTWPASELSGIEPIPHGWYMVISDDRGEEAPPRFGFVRLDFIANPATGEPSFRGIGRVDMHPLFTPEGETFKENVIDPESIRLLGEEDESRQFLVASEGYAKDGIGPKLYLFDQAKGGAPLDVTPPEFEVSEGKGIRHNRGFEALGVTPDKAWAYTANEEPLIQDEASGCVRLIEVDLNAKKATREFAYKPGPATLCEKPKQLGLVEMVALDRGRLLTLERDEDGKGGFDGRLYLVDLDGATDVSGHEALDADTSPVTKTLLGTLSETGAPSANYEGFCLGPKFATGQLVILVSDGDTEADRAARFTLLMLSGDLEGANESSDEHAGQP